MGKGLIASTTLHVIVIALLIVCFGGSVRKHQETITIFLTDAPLPGGRPAAGKAGLAPTPLKRLPPVQTRQGRAPTNERSGPAIPGRAGLSAPRPETDKEMPLDKATTAPENPTLSTFFGGAATSAAPRDAAEGTGPGGGTGAGVAGGGTGGGRSDAGSGAGDGADPGKKNYLERNFAYIRDLIVKNLKYPYAARRMGWKGSVTVSFVILENGTTEALRVTHSSGHDLLDQSVLKTVRALQPFPRPPVRAELVIPIAFRLE